MSSEITETMLKFNDEKEKELNKEEEKTKQNIKKLDKEEEKLNKQYKQKLKELIDAGGFSMEGIIEIKMICHLIRNCPSELENKKEDMAKCLEILVNMSNQYLQLYKKENEIE